MNCVFFVVVFFRSDPSEGSRDQRPEAEDSRSHGRHAQHLLHGRHQQHDSRDPPLLLKVHGHQSLQPGPQRFCLPAPQKVNASSLLFRSAPPFPPSALSTLLLLLQTPSCRGWELKFSSVLSFCQVRRMLYCVTVFVVVKTKDKKNKNTQNYLKTDIPWKIRKPRLFLFKCLVKPHRFRCVSSSQGCSSSVTAAFYQLSERGRWVSFASFFYDS